MTGTLQAPPVNSDPNAHNHSRATEQYRKENTAPVPFAGAVPITERASDAQ